LSGTNLKIVTGDLTSNFGAQALTDLELDKNVEIIKSLKDGAFENLTGINCSTDGQGCKINISYLYS